MAKARHEKCVEEQENLCQEEIIRKRVADRAKQTGRSIPETMLVASIEAVERPPRVLPTGEDRTAP